MNYVAAFSEGSEHTDVTLNMNNVTLQWWVLVYEVRLLSERESNLHKLLCTCVWVAYIYIFLPESFRDVATLHNIIPQLVPLLVPSSNSQLQTSSSSFSNTQLQAMRAIANLCYDHGQASISHSKQSHAFERVSSYVSDANSTSVKDLPFTMQMNSTFCIHGCILPQ